MAAREVDLPLRKLYENLLQFGRNEIHQINENRFRGRYRKMINAIGQVIERLRKESSTNTSHLANKNIIEPPVFPSTTQEQWDKRESYNAMPPVVNAIEIRDKVKEMTQNGTTVLLSSHNMLEIEMLSDRVAIIDKGKIIDSGETKQVFKKINP